MGMHKGHRERIKNRFLSEGLDNFEDHQVLELILFYAIPMKDTNELAHTLIKQYGSLSAVLEADVEDLMTVPGIGRNAAVLLSLIPSLARRYFKDRWGDRPKLNSTSKAGEYLISLFAGRSYELFYILCLDAQNRLNHAALVHEGTIDQTAVYPRLVVEAALRHQSSSIIISHNHPGGTLRPSAADIEVTKIIKSALEPISIEVLDHIVVAGDKYFSFADSGLV